MLAALKTIADDKSGATAIEYGLIAALLCVGIMGAITGFGASVNNMWNSISTTVIAAINV